MKNNNKRIVQWLFVMTGFLLMVSGCTKPPVVEKTDPAVLILQLSDDKNESFGMGKFELALRR